MASKRAEVNPIIVISFEDAMQSCLEKMTMILVFNGLYVRKKLLSPSGDLGIRLV